MKTTDQPYILSLSKNLFHIFLRRGDRREIELLNKEFQYARRYKCRERRPKKNILDTEVQESQKNTNSLLLVPRKHHRKREVVDSAVERFGESHGNLDGTVRIGSLSHIHQSWESADRTKIEIVKAIFTASKR